MSEELEHRIRERAHLIWEREGRPSGREEAHWAQASAEIAAEAAPAAAKPRAKRAAAPKVAAEKAAAPKRRSPAKPKAT